VCIDQPDFDVSAPKSSNTYNSDITCEDAVTDSSPKGKKWKECMTCLQGSDFSQGKDSDQKWFLYNLRYSLAHCIFGFPNATGIGTTPCSTSMACGPLQSSLQHGILNPDDTTAFSYCSANGGAAMDSLNYEHCTSCVSVGGKTKYLTNYFVALQAGCLQKPEIGRRLGLSDEVFANETITVVDPLTMDEEDTENGPGLAVTSIVGIVVGALAVILIVAAVIFICRRKRKNRRSRASAEENYNRFRYRSSLSFQCQTHAMSPRHWPGVGEMSPAAGDETVDPALYAQQHQQQQQQAENLTQRHSLWKPHDSVSSFSGATEKAWESPYQQPLGIPSSNADNEQKKESGLVAAAAPLHSIRTSIPTMPPHAHMSPLSDFQTPLSAESTHSTSALLPTGPGIKPYIPSEHGIHGSNGYQIQGSPRSPGLSTFNSPISGTTASPLLRSYGWPEQKPQQPSQLQQRASQQRLSSISTLVGGSSHPPPPPPQQKSPRFTPGALGSSTFLSAGKKDSNVGIGMAISGSPVESWKIQTTFAGPPPKKR